MVKAMSMSWNQRHLLGIMWILIFFFSISYYKQQLKELYSPQPTSEKKQRTRMSVRRVLNCNIPTLPRGWCFDEDDSVPRYVGKTDQESQKEEFYYSHEEFDECLANKTIVMIGDSRVRYQFLHLLDFLKEGNWMKCSDSKLYNLNITEASERCYFINHDEYSELGGKWSGWFSSTSANLIQRNQGDNTQGPSMTHICDCYRAPGDFDTAKITENRYVQRMTSFGRARLVYIQLFDDTDARMDRLHPPFSPHWGFDDAPAARCAPGDCGPENRKDAFQGHLQSIIHGIVPSLHATHVFANLGWDHIFGPNAQASLACQFEDLNRQPNIQTKYYMITHPRWQKGFNKSYFWDPTNMENFECQNPPVLDRSTMSIGVPKEWYWNGPHALGILNEEFNHQMIKKICPFESSIAL